MILLDSNLLVYAFVSSLPQHEKARPWLDSVLSGTAQVAMPWPSLLGFVRIATNPVMFARPVTIPEAWKVVETWIDCPVVWMPGPTDRHKDVLREMLAASSNRRHLITDAHLAALAIEHGLVLCSADRDFARFPGLRWENPLQR